MRKPRSLVPIPRQLAVEIDRIAGHKHRSAFIVELVEREIRRREQLDALQNAAGSWPDREHPELADGADNWVRGMRQKSVERLEAISRRRAK
jgi:hypothetical protein